MHILTLLTHPDLHIRYCQDLGVQSTPELVASQRKRVRRTPRGDVLTEKDAQIHPHVANCNFSSVQACGVRPDGCTRTCRTRFTNGFRGFHARSPRHTLMLLTGCAQERSTAACMQGRTRVVMGPTCTHPCTRAHSEGRAPCLRSLRRVLLEPSPCVESPGEHEDEGLPYVRERTSRTNHVCAGSPTGEEAGAAIGCSMASTVLPYCPSSLLPHPVLLDSSRQWRRR